MVIAFRKMSVPRWMWPLKLYEHFWNNKCWWELPTKFVRFYYMIYPISFHLIPSAKLVVSHSVSIKLHCFWNDFCCPNMFYALQNGRITTGISVIVLLYFFFGFLFSFARIFFSSRFIRIIFSGILIMHTVWLSGVCVCSKCTINIRYGVNHFFECNISAACQF